MAKVAEIVCQILNQSGIEAILIPLQRSMFNFLRRIKELNVQVIVNLCEGFFGNPHWESNVAAVMEVLHIAFTGNGARTLALCQDKHQAKAILSSFNLPVAPSQLITSADEIVELRFPMIIKPNSEDASLGVHLNLSFMTGGLWPSKSKELLQLMSSRPSLRNLLMGGSLMWLFLMMASPKPCLFPR